MNIVFGCFIFVQTIIKQNTMKQILTLVISFMMVTAGMSAEKSTEANHPSANLQTVSNMISGKVFDKNSGESLAGVAIKIPNTEYVVYSDFEGNFCIQNITPGEYKLNAEFISYHKIEIEKIQINNHEVHELQIRLTQDF